MTALATIEGIGPVYAGKLEAAGVTSVEDLLEKGATRSGRQHIEDLTGIDHARVLTWVNHADLCRIDGVAAQYAELLESAGVDSVPELARRNPSILLARMTLANKETARVGRLPSETQIAGWIQSAKLLPRVVL